VVELVPAVDGVEVGWVEVEIVLETYVVELV